MNKFEMMRMLELSSIAYRDNQPLCNCTKMVVVEDEKTDTECFVRIRDGLVIVTFRGTDSKRNWMNNFCFAKRSVPYDNTDTEIRVHEGFLRTYRSVRKKIHDLIPQGACRVIVTGHSLGAALAVLCAVDIQYNFPHKDVQAYLFGCPRVGNKAFSKSYNKRVFKTLRIVNGNDIVTKVPFAFMGYRHVGAKLKIGKNAGILPFSMKSHTLQEYYSNIWYF